MTDDPSSGRHNEHEIRRFILERLSALLEVAPDDIDPTAPFSSLGVDSVGAVEVVAALEDELERKLEPTLVYSAETASQLAALLASGGGGQISRQRQRPAPVLAGVHEPIAIVGIGCRFPGASGVDDYWTLLADGVNAVGEVPDGRWDDLHFGDVPESTRRGGFIADIDQFDPTFFGITQLEAERMDPQQRLLLEVGWEALENAGIRPSSLRGTDVGVFVGISTTEYSRRQSADPGDIDPFFGTGNALSIAANRISYALDLSGPSLAVDTACSSSLVAVHLACESLRRGECSSALAGGANAILTPLVTLSFIGAGVISPEGRCKTFDASADGIVRGEGAGLVVLKRLSDAEAAGDRIYSVIEGSAVNQDGRSNGLTAPNPEAQMAVFATACSSAGIEPGSVGYVEAHGTGTVLGDAMELRSLDAVYGGDRPEGSALLVGSVKTNIGHLEAAAGIAGLIKTSLAVHHRHIPATLHYEDPNPYLEQTASLRVASMPNGWDDDMPRRAAVSGFGFGGTNAHVILSPAPAEANPAETIQGPANGPGPDDTRALLLPLSARTSGSLTRMASRHLQALDDGADTGGLAAAQALTRDELSHRLAVVGSPVDIRDGLRSASTSESHRAIIAGERRGSEPARIAFLFSGQGRAWWPLDGELLEDPVVRSVLESCDRELREMCDFSALELIRSGDPVMDHGRAQPLLYSLQVALAARWRAFGVEPDLIVGQSIGEIAAAHVAGAMSLAEGLEIVVHRGRLMEESNGTGHTAFVELPADETEQIIAELGAEVAIAAVTAPDNCVVSGPKADTAAVVEAAEARGVVAQIFPVGDIPGHGPLMAPYAERLAEEVDFLRPRRTSVDMISSVTAQRVEGTALDASYWGANLRQQVRLLEAIKVAADEGADLFLEIAPHPVASFSTRRTLEWVGSKAKVQHTVKQGETGHLALRRSLAAAWVAGATVDWRAVTGYARAPLDAPTYPWDHRRCWIESGSFTPSSQRTDGTPRWHPTLGKACLLGDDTITWPLDGAGTSPVWSTGQLLEAALSAVTVATGSTSIELSGIELADVRSRDDSLGGGSEVPMSLTVRRGDHGTDWWISREGSGSVVVVARGVATAVDAPPVMLERSRLASHGQSTGSALLRSGVVVATSGESEALITVGVSTSGATDSEHSIAPEVLDDALDASLACRSSVAAFDAAVRRVDRLVLRGDPGSRPRVLVKRSNGHVTIADEWGAAVVEIEGVAATGTTTSDRLPKLAVPSWQPEKNTDEHGTTAPTLVVADIDDDVARRICERFAVDVVDPAGVASHPDVGPSDFVVMVIGDRERDPDEPGPAESARAWVDRGVGMLAIVEQRDRSVSGEHHGGRSRPSLSSAAPAILRSSANVTVVELDDQPDSIERLLDVLGRSVPGAMLSIRDGLVVRGQLELTQVPAPLELTETADGRPFMGVWDDHGGVVCVLDDGGEDQARRGSAEAEDILVVDVDHVLVGSSELRRRPPGGPVGVAAVGRVVPADGSRASRAGAVIRRGSAASRIVVRPEEVLPIPDGALDAALSALARLDALHGDLQSAVEADPELVASSFSALLAQGDEWAGPRSTLGAELQVSDRATVLDVDGTSTSVRTTTHRWQPDEETTYLVVGDDSPTRTEVLRFLLARGATETVATSAREDGSGQWLDQLSALRSAGRPVGMFATDSSAISMLDAVLPDDRLDPLVWIGSPSVLLGASPPERNDADAAATMARRSSSGLGGTTLLVPEETVCEQPLLTGVILDRLLINGVEVAAFDPDEVDAIAGTVRGEGGAWFGRIGVTDADDLPAAEEGSIAARLATTASGDREGVVADHLAEQIAAIIGIKADEIDRDRPVSDYGVDSLVGMEMRASIETDFRYLVPLSQLSRTMTVNELAGHVTDNAVARLLRGSVTAALALAAIPDEERSTAVPVTSGHGPLSWWVPGIFGTSEVFAALGTELADHRIYSLESAADAPEAITDLALAHIRVIKATQPEGPYRIGGFSFGAMVAAEIVAQMQRDGTAVETLWLLDPPDIGDTRRDRDTIAARVAPLLRHHLQELFSVELPDDLPPLGADADLVALAESITTRAGTAFDRERIQGLLTGLWRSASKSVDAMSSHAPTGRIEAPTRIVFAGADTMFAASSAQARGWDTILPSGTREATVDSDHEGLLRTPHVAGVAELIRRDCEPKTTISTEDRMTSETLSARRTGALRTQLIEKVVGSPRTRAAVGAVGSAYRQTDFFLRAFAADRRFRKLCVPGDGLIVGDHAHLTNLSSDPTRVRFGDHCLIDGAVNVQEYGYFTMGSYSGLGEGVRIDCSGYVEIGNGCTLAEGVYVIDGLHHPILVDERIEHGIDLFEGNHVMDAYTSGTETSFVRIEDLVWIGLRAIVLSGVTIGRGSVVAAGAVVSQDIPPFSVVAGNPGRVVGRIPPDDVDISSHPVLRARRGDAALPDHRRDPAEVLDEIARQIAARPS